MKNFFTPAFFRFLLGFCVMILLSFVLISIFATPAGGV